jgi:hypothetical protein
MRFIKNLLIMVSVAAMLSCAGDGGFNADSESPQTGQGGSMARFAFHDNYLYVLNHTSIIVFDIANDNFSQLGTEQINSGMETIFVNGDYLYLGANDAMYIYSIENPSSPEFVFRYQHITSCDPVVVQGNRAYVTMRGGTACNAGANALEILDISDPEQPLLLRNHPMESPYGLGITGNVLFICEGAFGLKVFNVNSEGDIQLMSHKDDFNAYDVIVRPNHAIVTGEDGIFQFTFSDNGNNFQQVSSIPVTRVPL